MKKTKPLAVIILAAGKGKRMNNPDNPKVLVDLKGKPIISYVLDKVDQLIPDKVIMIVGHLKENIIEFVNKSRFKNVSFVSQDNQLGTGHAVDQAREELNDFEGNVLILAGDVPLITKKALENFIIYHKEYKSDLSVLTTIAPDPTGYGRIVRDKKGSIIRIIEHKDANEEEKQLKEINSGIFLVDSGLLFKALSKVSNENAQGEYYLTDIVDILKKDGRKVMAYNGAQFDELQGVNSPDDLRKVTFVFDRIFKN